MKGDAIEDILRALPELTWVASDSLRKWIADTWVDALEESEWGQIENAVFNPKCPSVSLVRHVRGVTRIASRIVEVHQDLAGEDIDQATVIGGCLLHDVGKLLEYEPTPNGPRRTSRGAHLAHWVYGVHLAAAHGIPDKILDIIANHTDQNRLEPVSVEAVIVYAADTADANLHRLAAGQPLLH